MTYLEYLELVLAQVEKKLDWLCYINKHIYEKTGYKYTDHYKQLQSQIRIICKGRSFITTELNTTLARTGKKYLSLQGEQIYRIYMIKRFIGEEKLKCQAKNG